MNYLIVSNRFCIETTRFFSAVAWVILVQTVSAALGIKDSPELPFRRAPMADASRSAVVPLGHDYHLAFDSVLLRIHSVWEGPGLNLVGPSYVPSKKPFICWYEGRTVWKFPPMCPWGISQDIFDTEKISRWIDSAPQASFQGISTKGAVTTFIYHIKDSRGQPVVIHESASVEALERGGGVRLTRRFEVGPSFDDLMFIAYALEGKIVSSQRDRVFGIQETERKFFIGYRGWSKIRHQVFSASPVFTTEILDEEGTENRKPLTEIRGVREFVVFMIPAHQGPVVLEIADQQSASPDSSTMPVGLKDWSERIFKKQNMAFLSSVEPKSESPKLKINPVLISQASVKPSVASNPFYHLDPFPIPGEIDLIVGGMDFLPNGNLAVCTWPGEVYSVAIPPFGSSKPFSYQKMADGLMEPLGLKVLDGRIHIAQKCELTRLTDTDFDGQIDLFECLNQDWGFTGNYHSFTFGPIVGSSKEFYLFITGQRARRDMPYGGWCVRISPDGSELEGVASGFRTPHGFGLFEPSGELFMSDNQGNWIGTSKINHVQQGRFYGYPSSVPAPVEHSLNPEQFSPPAVWIPRNLSRSSSGLVTITNESFGPFYGQMLVGEFQNATVLRVALEKVQGEWQGTVWPFMKGFGSGVNRLVFGPDGSLFVGGGQKTWTSVKPVTKSLDRVRFSGRVPFEVKEVHAKPDGFELVFTKPVDSESVGDSDNYSVTQFGYRYHSVYGSPEIDHDGNSDSSTDIEIKSVEISADGIRVGLVLEGLKPGYVTAFDCFDLKSRGGQALWHEFFYYTLNHIPEM
ncbi:MAG TPA: hypothetical protein EYQ50_03285 [Verrucomicrobiales bacterium]|nr:hypothetical protein [Verrucomicrobiales bacterium]